MDITMKQLIFYGWGSNISNSHIEATHYISERKFFRKNFLTVWMIGMK